MKKILLIIIILFVIVSVGYCQYMQLNDETKQVSKEIIENIYKDILKIKSQHDGLEAFDENVISEDGLRIDYRKGLEKNSAYSFSIRIYIERLLDKSEFPPSFLSYESFYIEFFPNLGVGIRAYYFYCINKPGLSVKAEDIVDVRKKIKDIIVTEITPLRVLNQKRFPLQLIIKSDKEVYEVGEEINIGVQIKNKDKKAVKLIMSSPWHDYEVELLDRNDNLIPMTDIGRRQWEVRKTKMFEYFRRFIKNIQVGEDIILDPIVLNEWYEVTKPGIYYLKVYRRIKDRGEYSLKSNIIPIEVAGKGISKNEAIAIAKKAMKETNINIDEHYLESVKEMQWNNQDAWLITYEMKENLQLKSQGLPMICGGEIYIKIDKKSGESIVTYGE